MKVVFRADDMGYSDICNLGCLKTIDEGVTSMVEVMMDTPGADSALAAMKKRPWVTLCWHSHYWGSPVADADMVPSLVKDGRFRSDIEKAEDIDFEELVFELRAEVEKCVTIYGKAPFAASGTNGDSICAKAKRQVCDEYGIIYGYDRYWHYGPEFAGHKSGPNDSAFLNPRYESLKIYEYENFGASGLSFDTYTDYDPLAMIKTMPLDTDCIFVRCQHPGFLDDYVLRETLKRPESRVNVHRLKDVEVYCSAELKEWIDDNSIEIINLEDAITGSGIYQDHVRKQQRI